MTIFALPDLGEGLQEAELVSWHVSEGDHVVEDQPLVAVETEKAVVEIPSPQSGRIARLLAKAGDRVKVGAPLVEFEEGTPADTGTVVGELTSEGRLESPAAMPRARLPGHAAACRGGTGGSGIGARTRRRSFRADRHRSRWCHHAPRR